MGCCLCSKCLWFAPASSQEASLGYILSGEVFSCLSSVPHLRGCLYCFCRWQHSSQCGKKSGRTCLFWNGSIFLASYLLKCEPRTRAPVSPGSWLKMQTLRAHPRPTESKSGFKVIHEHMNVCKGPVCMTHCPGLLWAVQTVTSLVNLPYSHSRLDCYAELQFLLWSGEWLFDLCLSNSSEWLCILGFPWGCYT